MVDVKALTPRATDYAQWYLDVIKAAPSWPTTPGARLHGHQARTATPSGRRCSATSTGCSRTPATSTPTSRCFIPAELPEPRRRSTSRASPRSAPSSRTAWRRTRRNGTPRGHQRAGRAADHPADSETIIGHMYSRVGAELPRPAAADQPVVQRHALGDADTGCSCARPSSSGRKATPPTRREGGGGGDAADARRLRRLRRGVTGDAGVIGPKTDEREVPRGRHTLCIEALMQDGKALQDGHEPRPRAELRQGVRRQVPGPRRAEAGLTPGRRAGASPRG